MKKLFIILLLIISFSLMGCDKSDEPKMTLLAWCKSDIEENYIVDLEIYILEYKEVYFGDDKLNDDFPETTYYYIVLIDGNGYKYEYISGIYYKRGLFDCLFGTPRYKASQIGSIDSDELLKGGK